MRIGSFIGTIPSSSIKKKACISENTAGRLWSPLIVIYPQCITCFKGRSFGVLWRHRCLFGFISAHTRRERGLQFLMAVSCCCRKFPLISSSPRPHILPPLFPCFRGNSDDSEKHNWRVKTAVEYVRALAVSRWSPPSVADRWYGLPLSARSLTVLCAVPVAKGGLVAWD